ncbi:hypothetical protein ACFQ3P_09000 [Paraburkholderia sabiae]|uniref:Uncharacterized protein n=1 Tax=Paraburkholderia sabiae TaxID=273251 RepID=A0ABU9QKL6_9BURK|nr:hypothetical protein [Paraburkholderia sabiae]
MIALEKLRAKRLFENLDLPADGALRHAQRYGRAVETHVPCRLFEKAQRDQRGQTPHKSSFSLIFFSDSPAVDGRRACSPCIRHAARHRVARRAAAGSGAASCAAILHAAPDAACAGRGNHALTSDGKRQRGLAYRMHETDIAASSRIAYPDD